VFEIPELVDTSAWNNYICERTRREAAIALFLNNQRSVDQVLTPTKGRTCCAILSRLMHVTCFLNVLLKNYFPMLTLVWQGHTNILVGMALAIPLPPPLLITFVY